MPTLKTLSHGLPATALATLLAGSLGLPSTLQAQHTYQPRTGITSWHDNGNWSPSGAPDATDSNVFLQSTSPAGAATTQLTQTVRIGMLNIDLSNGNWGISSPNSQGRFQWSTSGSFQPTLNVKNTISSQSLTIGIGMLDDISGPKALNIYGEGVNGASIAFTGNNTGFTGGINLRSTVEQNISFTTVASLGSNTVTAYTSGHKIRLGSGTGVNTFDNRFHMESGVSQLYLMSNASAGGKTVLGGEISGGGNVDFRTYGGGDFELTGTNTYTGNTTITTGVEVTFHDVSNFGTGNRIEFALAGDAPTLTFAEGNTSDLTKKADGSVRIVDLRNANVTFDTGSNNVTFANAVTTAFIDNPTPYGGIIKKGSGILRLEGDNRYKVITRVAEGTLLINNTSGSGTGSSAVEVESTLGGTGSVRPEGDRSILVKAGGVLSPGDAAISGGIGTLTLDLDGTTGNLTFEALSRVALDLDSGGTSDRLLLVSSRDGSVEFLGATYLDLNDLSGGQLELGDYTLWEASGNAIYQGLQLDGNRIVGGLLLGNMLNDYNASLWLENGDVILKMEAIPEPATVSLLLSVAFGMILYRHARASR